MSSTVTVLHFAGEHILALIETHRITHMCLVPTMAKRLLDLPAETRARYRLDSLEHVVSTGAPFPPDLKEAMMSWWGAVIHECYAATEPGWVTYQNNDNARRALERDGLLAAYKVPRQVLFQVDLPSEDTGKIFKRRLRDPYWANQRS